MKTKKTEIVDFYRQLSLLLDSSLPLPESLRQLAANFQKKEFKETLSNLADETNKGTPLSDAMKKFPEIFQPFHVKMIEGGEKSGTLPEILSEIAYMSHVDLQLVSMVKTMAAYPITVIFAAFNIMFFIYTFIVPNFKRVFEELLEGVSLPPLTQFVINLSDLCVSAFPLILTLMLLFVGFVFWLFFSRTALASRIFINIIRIFPLSKSIFYNLMMARVCSMWSVFVRQKMSAHEAFGTMAGFIEDARLSSAMKQISRKLYEGKSLVDSLREQGAISGLVAVMVKHCPEDELSGELANLADIYKDRAAGAIKNAELIWEAFLIIGMSIMAGSVVIGLFMPLIKIIEVLGGA
jgi:type II secretory pathway component PulF